MKIMMIIVLLMGSLLQSLLADTLVTELSHSRPVHTYSIVARDPDSGQMGVAVQSHWFSIGSLVPWAEAGVGVVATQSFIDVRYGASGLDLMRSGWNAPQALDAIRKADANSAVRQVAMIDVHGNVAVHTGKKCIQYAGHATGDNFSVQANLMLNDNVWVAMAQTYHNTSGALEERLLKVLEAAQATGGDLRGKQSAAMIVVAAKSTGRPWKDRIIDLHVEDHPAPLQELRRLMKIRKAYRHMNRGDHAFEQNHVQKAVNEYGAAQALFPENPEMKFWLAVSLVNAGRVDNALPIFKRVFNQDKNWHLLVPRLSAVDLLPSDQAVIGKILSVVPEQ